MTDTQQASEGAEPTMAEIDAIGSVDTTQPVSQETSNPAQEPQSEPEAVTSNEDGQDQSYYDKRINKIHAEKIQQRNRADRLEKELSELKSGARSEVVTDNGSAPKIEDFDYDDSRYRDALIDHRVESALQARDELQVRHKVEQTAQANEARFLERAVTFQNETKDYTEVLGKLPFFQESTIGAIRSIENGPEVAYHLGQNLELAGRIADLDSVSAAIELGRLAHSLNTNETTAVRQSNAPAPITPVSSSGGTLVKPEGDKTMEEIFNDL